MYISRGPSQIRIWKEIDPVSGKLAAYRRPDIFEPTAGPRLHLQAAARHFRLGANALLAEIAALHGTPFDGRAARLLASDQHDH